MTMSWRASAARLGHAAADGSVMSRSPQRPARRPAAGTADAQAPGPGRHQVRLIFSALTLGILLAALDQTIAATALPTPHRPPRPAGAAAARPGPSRSHHRPRPRRVRAAALSGRRAYRLPAALPL